MRLLKSKAEDTSKSAQIYKRNTIKKLENANKNTKKRIDYEDKKDKLKIDRAGKTVWKNLLINKPTKRSSIKM